MISWNYSRTAIELTIKRNSTYHSYSPKWRIGKEESIQKASISTFSFLHCSTSKRIKFKKKIRAHQLRATKNRLQIWLWVNELNASCVLSLLHHLQLKILRIYCCFFLFISFIHVTSYLSQVQDHEQRSQNDLLTDSAERVWLRCKMKGTSTIRHGWNH